MLVRRVGVAEGGLAGVGGPRMGGGGDARADRESRWRGKRWRGWVDGLRGRAEGAVGTRGVKRGDGDGGEGAWRV